jgi:hypothetical protein
MCVHEEFYASKPTSNDKAATPNQNNRAKERTNTCEVSWSKRIKDMARAVVCWSSKVSRVVRFYLRRSVELFPPV